MNLIEAKAAINMKCFRNILIVIILVLMDFDNAANAKYFDSMNSLQELKKIEVDLVKAFHGYLEVQEKEFESYKKFVETIKLEHSIAQESVEDYLGNPINAFRLIKRLVSDWNNLHDLIRQSKARKGFREAFDKLEELKQFFDNEFNGAVKGLVRLQKFYGLSEKDLAEGVINGMITNTKLSWSDCFEIAIRLFHQKELTFSLKWFEKALVKLNGITDDMNDASYLRYEIEIFEYLALNHYELGNTQIAVNYIDKILEVEPNHNVIDLRIYVKNSNLNENLRKNKEDFNQNYTQLCHGIRIPQIELHSLKCSLTTRGIPFFILAPLKMEELYKDPEINIYHGLLTNKQIYDIVNDTENEKFPTSIVHGNGNNQSSMHISQQSLRSYENPAMKSLQRLLEQLTKTNLTNSDPMTITNYGIVGHYDPNFDFEKIPNKNDFEIRDRFATNLFYLSNVELGGLTVFPKLNIFISPVKGSMVSWHNLHRSLDPDYRTLNADCPVIIGSKTISTIWVHSDFLQRPCLLENDSQKSQGYL